MKTIVTFLLLFPIVFAAQPSRAQVPPAPTMVSAVASFYYVPDIYLSWHSIDNSIGSASYRIYRSPGDSSHFEFVGTSYYTTYVDFQILGGQVYYYYITSNVIRDTTRYESAPSSFISAIAVSQRGGGASKRKNNGTIAGRVTDSLTGKALPEVQLSFYRVSSPGVPVQKLVSDGSGHYRAALDTGTYIIKAQPLVSGGAHSYSTEWYRDALDPAHAERILVDDSSRIQADIDLAKQGAATQVAVTGMVMDSTGAPLKGAMVVVLRSIQDMEEHSSSNDDGSDGEGESRDIEDIGHAQGVVWQGVVDSLGAYRAPVPAGHAYVVLAVKMGYAPQFFDHQSNQLTANPLWLAHDTSGINFNLGVLSPAASYTVTGTVRDSSGVRVPSRIVLIPLNHQSGKFAPQFVFTDSVGAFVVTHVHSGRYVALALPFSLYAPAYFKKGFLGIRRWQMADTISVAGDVSGVDIGVTRISVGGINHVSGSVTSGGTPAQGANVFAEYADGSIAGYGLTDAGGFYTLNGLPSETISISGDLEGYGAADKVVTFDPGNLSISGVSLILSPATVSSVSPVSGIAAVFAVDQNYPNPFNPSTTIAYSLPVVSSVSIRIYSITGQEVADLFEGVVAPGRYEAVWGGRDRSGHQVASGVYFYRYTAAPVSGGNGFQSMKKMLLLK
jgi:hypothetical protein